MSSEVYSIVRIKTMQISLKGEILENSKIWAKSAKVIENHLSLVKRKRGEEINYNSKFQMETQFSTKNLIATQN